MQEINLGTLPNDSTGDDLRTAFTKVNSNFAELDARATETALITVSSIISNNLVHSVQGTTAGKTVTLKTIGAGDGISVEENDEILTISALRPSFKLSEDAAPLLSNPLSLNSHSIIGTGSISITGSISGTSVSAEALHGNLIGQAASISVLTATGGVITGLSELGTKSSPIASAVMQSLEVGDATTILNNKIQSIDGEFSSLRSNNIIVTGTLKMPQYSTLEQSLINATAGQIIFNTETKEFLGYNGSEWVKIG